MAYMFGVVVGATTNGMYYLVYFLGVSTTNIWYVSEFGTDDNDCRSEFSQCRHLQTILDRARDGAQIYVTSGRLLLSRGKKTASMPKHIAYEKSRQCPLVAGISFTLRSGYHGNTQGSSKIHKVEVHCPGE